MLKSLHIEQFKQFRTLDLPDLGQINLIVGVNDVGKTSLLEALMGFACGLNTQPLQHLLITHRMDHVQQWSISSAAPNLRAEAILGCFHNYRHSQQLCCHLAGKIDDELHRLEYQFCPSAETARKFLAAVPAELARPQELVMQKVPGSEPVPAYFLGELRISLDEQQHSIGVYTPDSVERGLNDGYLIKGYFVDLLGHRQEQGNMQIYAGLSRNQQILPEFCRAMNEAFPDFGIQSIENVPYEDGTQAPLSCRMSDGELRPLYSFGDGVRRWFTILGNMLLARGGMQCIDEVDATFHHEAQSWLTRNLYKMSQRYQTQLFMTTHSLEFLQTFLQTLRDDLPEMLPSVRLITLRNCSNGGEQHICQRTLKGDAALEALYDGLELRK